MPPPTPRTMFMTRCLKDYFGEHRFFHRRKANEFVLHQSAPNLFHGDDGGLLGGSRQHRPGTALQLAGALGGHDDETVGALFRVVRDGAMRVVARYLVAHVLIHPFVTRSSRKFPESAGPALPCGPAAPARLAQLPPASRGTEPGQKRLPLPESYPSIVAHLARRCRVPGPAPVPGRGPGPRGGCHSSFRKPRHVPEIRPGPRASQTRRAR